MFHNEIMAVPRGAVGPRCKLIIQSLWARQRFLQLHVPTRAVRGDRAPGADAVVRLILGRSYGSQPRRVVAAGLPRSKGRRERGLYSLLPQVRRPVVRVSRDPLLAAYSSESLLGHVDITESWERHGFLHSMALFRPLQNARDNLVHNQP